MTIGPERSARRAPAQRPRDMLRPTGGAISPMLTTVSSSTPNQMALASRRQAEQIELHHRREHDRQCQQQHRQFVHHAAEHDVEHRHQRKYRQRRQRQRSPTKSAARAGICVSASAPFSMSAPRKIMKITPEISAVPSRAVLQLRRAVSSRAQQRRPAPVNATPIAAASVGGEHAAVDAAQHDDEDHQRPARPRPDAGPALVPGHARLGRSECRPPAHQQRDRDAVAAAAARIAGSSAAANSLAMFCSATMA